MCVSASHFAECRHSVAMLGFWSDKQTFCIVGSHRYGFLVSMSRDFSLLSTSTRAVLSWLVFMDGGFFAIGPRRQNLFIVRPHEGFLFVSFLANVVSFPSGLTDVAFRYYWCPWQAVFYSRSLQIRFLYWRSFQTMFFYCWALQSSVPYFRFSSFCLLVIDPHGWGFFILGPHNGDFLSLREEDRFCTGFQEGHFFSHSLHT